MKTLVSMLLLLMIGCSRNENIIIVYDPASNLVNQPKNNYVNYTIGDGPFVYFEDAKLKEILLNIKEINFNNDNQITFVEASNYKGAIDVSFKKITSMVGLEKFENLIALNIANNEISKVDFSMMKNLEYLDCSVNPFTDIDLQHNLKLKSFDITNSQLVYIDLTKNPDLVRVSGQCNYKLKSINIKNGNNKKIQHFSFWLNETVLECVVVDDISYVKNNTAWYLVSNARYSTEPCIGLLKN